MSSSDQYLKLFLSFVTGSGLGRDSKIHQKIISIFILSPTVVLLYILAFCKCADTTGDIILISEIIESLASFTQLSVRKCTLFLHVDLLTEIVEDYRNFWKYQVCGPKFATKMQKQLDFSVGAFKSFVYAGLATVILLILTPFSDEDKIVPLTIWLPENKFAIAFIYLFQVMLLFETLYYLWAIDGFFVMICTEIRIQFTLLRELLRTIKFGIGRDRDYYKQVISCSKHHRFLVKVHQKIGRFFSIYFVIQYGISLLGACVQIYIILYRSPSLNDLLKAILYLSCMFVQIALFFMPASNIEIEANNFANEIYNINWEDVEDLTMLKEMVFILMQAQKPVIMKGAGIVHINRNEYIVVKFSKRVENTVFCQLFRRAFSAATIMGKMMEK